MFGIFKKQEKSLPVETKEFFSPNKISLQEAIENIENVAKTYYAAASPEAVRFLTDQVRKVYPWIKYFKANRGKEENVNLFDHTVRTVILLLRNYSTASSLRIHQREGINYSLGERYKWEEVFEAALVAIYHDFGKIFSQKLSFLSDDGYAYKYKFSFKYPPDAYFSIIEQEDNVRFIDVLVEHSPSAFRINHPLLSSVFFVRLLTDEEFNFLGERFFFPVVYFIANHHSVDTATIDRSAIKAFVDADRLAAVSEKNKGKRKISPDEIYEEIRARILKLRPSWNKQGSGVYTLEGDHLLLTAEFISSFNKEVLADYEGEISMLGILKVRGVTMTTFSSGKVVDAAGREIATLKKGGILVPASELFTENEIATKITTRYRFIRE